MGNRPHDISELRAHFPITEHSIYMDHAAVSPISTRVQAAMHRQTSMQVNHVMTSRPQFDQCYTSLREAIAQLVGTNSVNVAFVQNTSHGLSLLANGQTWRAGDNIVVPAMEFPSNFLTWLRLEALGVECRRVEVPDGRMTADRIAQAIDHKTRIVALSAVQYYNGFRCDLAAISEIVEANGALLVVDGTQAVGAVQVDLSQHPIDALVVSAHKWMLGPLGIGFMVLSDRMLERTEVTQVGWLSVNNPFAFHRELDLVETAERFESGTENSAGLFGLHTRIEEIHDFGMPEIESRILALTEYLADQLRRIGCSITSPSEPGARSGILTFQHEQLDPAALVKALKDDRIFLSARHGSIRVSPHYYNSEEEIREVAERIEKSI